MKNIRLLSSFFIITIFLGSLFGCKQKGSEGENETDTVENDNFVQEPNRTSAQLDVKLELRQSQEYGNYLTDGEGKAVYMFKADTTLKSTCYDDCAEAWPPFTVEEGVLPVAGTGLDQSLVGTFTRKNGELQVAYAGWPLYYYEKDENAGDTKGQDIKSDGAEWYLLNAKGEEVHGESH